MRNFGQLPKRGEEGWDQRVIDYLAPFEKHGEFREKVVVYGKTGFIVRIRLDQNQASGEVITKLLMKCRRIARGQGFKVELRVSGILWHPILNVIRYFWSGKNTTIGERTIAILTNENIVTTAKYCERHQNESRFLTDNIGSSWILLSLLTLTANCWLMN